MVLGLESEYFKNEFFGEEFELDPLKKEVCLGIVCPDESIGDILADNFCDMGLLVFDQRNENPTKPFCNFEFEEYEDYISFFFYINESEIMSFSIPVEWDKEKLIEAVEPVFKNFWETHFEEVMEVRRYNRSIVEKLSRQNTAEAAGMIYKYYCRIEMDPSDKKFFWLKKWASRCSMGKNRLLKYYRQHHEYKKAEKLNWLLKGERKRKNF